MIFIDIDFPGVTEISDEKVFTQGRDGGYVSHPYSRTISKRKIGFFINLDLKAGIPARSGSMRDRDWYGYAGDTFPDYNHPSKWSDSKQNNYIDAAFMLDLSGGPSFPLFSHIYVRPYLFFSYMRITWNARDGSESEKDAAGNWSSETFSGSVVTYSQQWFIPGIGVSLHWPINRRFLTAAYFTVSPFLFCNDQDDHHSNYQEFNAYMRGGIMLEPKLQASFFITPRFSAFLNIGGRIIWGLRGYMTREYTSGIYQGQTTTSGDVAGAAFRVLDMNLGLKITL
jgi:outer membrane protease